MSDARRFASGKDAMRWLLDGPQEPVGSSRKPAQLDAEIRAELEGDRMPGTTGKPMAPFPGPRTPRQLRASVAKTTPKAPRSAKPKAGSMTPAKFLASLPPPFSRRGSSGANYADDTKLAKTIRAECKAAEACGALPVGTEVSVRVLHHKSLKVEIVKWIGSVFTDAYVEHLMDPKGTEWDSLEHEKTARRDNNYGLNIYRPTLVMPLNKALDLVDKIAERHNYNNSDSQSDYFDVGYYVTVDAGPIEEAARTAIASESNPKFAALLEEGHTAALALGPAATKSICGSSNLRSASEYCLERLIKIAKRAAGKPVKYDKRRGGWFPVEGDGEYTKLKGLKAVEP